MEEVVVSILETTTEHGAVAGLTQTQQVKYYNLDAVISVGLPGQFGAGDAIPYLGNGLDQGIHHQGLCHG